MEDARRIWIAGANGRLGQEINAILDPVKVELLNTDVEEVDVTITQDVLDFGDTNRPDAIINCAGMTDARACEKNVEKAFQVNALGARNLSIAARRTGAKIIHISTDDVFGGDRNTPYTEFDTPNPQSVYGRSKLAGENFVRELAAKHMIIRSSWIYGKEGPDFVSHILEQARHREKIRVASDQFASPTSAAELAKLVVYLMNTAEYGLYHGACEGFCSRYEFAKEVLRLDGWNVEVESVRASGLENVPPRPQYSVLDNFMMRISGVYKMPHWKEALSDFFTNQ